MKKKRLKNNLYFEQKIRWLEAEKTWERVSNEDGTLFSGNHRTKIHAADLPEWYVRGRYYKKIRISVCKGNCGYGIYPSMFSITFE